MFVFYLELFRLNVCAEPHATTWNITTKTFTFYFITHAFPASVILFIPSLDLLTGASTYFILVFGILHLRN